MRDALRTPDDRLVQVLHPGFWNREPGPDFRNAVVRIGDEPAVSGDVEVDLRSDGWRGHGHDRNSAYSNVILHVVWAATTRRLADRPTLAIGDRLDAPLAELQRLLDGERPPPLTEAQQGRCSAPLRALATEQRENLLRQAARVRLEVRASQLCARARQLGWESALVEGLFRGLGYKHNAWPMQRLGELVPKLRGVLEDSADANRPLAWQAVLLGTSGLLSSDASRRSSTGDHLRELWDIWWRLRDRCAEYLLPANLWRLAGIRPANHPQRRLALAAHWLSDPKFFKRLESWFAGVARQISQSDPAGATVGAVGELCAALNPGADVFWSHHCTLRSKAMTAPQALLGQARVTDLAVNVILPWFYTRAREGRNEAWLHAGEQLWFTWPAAEDNAVLRLARARLLGHARSGTLKTAAAQQGLLQIVRDFCDHSNAICEQCRFPQLVAGITPSIPSP